MCECLCDLRQYLPEITEGQAAGQGRTEGNGQVRNTTDSKTRPKHTTTSSIEIHEIVQNGIKETFNIFHHNVQGLTSKTETIEVLIQSIVPQPTLICLTEHWLDKDSINLFKLSNYTMIGNYSRVNRKRGGVVMFIKSEFQQYVREADMLSINCYELDFECTAVVIEKLNLVVAAVYRSQLGCYQKFLDSLEDFLNSIRKIHKKQVIICGDFNEDFLKESNDKLKFLSVINPFNINYVIKKPTRITTHSRTAIDNLLTDISIEKITYEISEGLSDHTCQLIQINLFNNIPTKNKTREIRNFSRRNLETFQNRLVNENWSLIYGANHTTDEKFTIFMDTLNEIFDKSFPKLLVQVKDKQKAGWITKEIKHYSRLKRQLIRNKQRTESGQTAYKYFINHYKKLIRNAKRNYYLQKITGSQQKTKKLWEVVNEDTNLKQRKTHTNISLTEEGKQINDPVEVSETFNTYFISVAANLNKESSLNVRHNAIDLLTKVNARNLNSMFLGPTTEYEISREIRNLDATKAVGDEIPVWIIKKINDSLTPILCYLFNKCFEDGIFPGKLKIAKVSPVYKKGDKTLPQNYRPISLLSTFSKLLEKLIKQRLLNFLNKCRIITKQQHGFISNKSTTTATCELVNYILEGINQKNKVLGMFCDLTKAFDLVDHNILLKKLEHYGIRGTSFEIIKSYLQNRQQAVEIVHEEKGNCRHFRSSSNYIRQGVPQGSILGPVLFLLYINDLPENIPEAQCILYADDTNVLIKDKCTKELHKKIAQVVETLKCWFSSNKLILNEEKTHYALFHTRQNHKLKQEVENDIMPLKLSNEIKFLGITFNENLNWQSHLQTLTKTLNSKIFALRILKNTLDTKSLIQVYYAVFHSLIKYGIIFWGISSNVDEIFRKQKQAVRVIMNLQNRASCREHFSRTKILTVPCVYIYEIALHTKKYYSSAHAKEHTYNSRQTNILETYFTRFSLVQQGPLHMGIKIYNKLPKSITAEDCTTRFGKQLKQYLSKKYITI